jgi:hypothetical protein
MNESEMKSPAPESFNIMLGDAARLSQQDVRSILDCIRAGSLSCAVKWTGEIETSVWISYEAVREMVRQGDVVPAGLTHAQRKIVEVCQGVRSMLHVAPPVTTTVEAVAAGTGVICQDRSREPYVFVRAKDVARHAQRVKRDPGHIEYAMLESVVVEALKKSGAERVRGIRGLDDKKQNWATWYRLPHSLVTPKLGEPSMWRVDLPQLDPELIKPESESPLLSIPVS